MNTKEILKKIRKIEIFTKDIVSDVFSGEYHSVFKGQGLEFSEVRQYQEGDSFRQIDWNVSAKMREPYIKKFQETRELSITFLVDGSASTLLGTKSSLKSEYIVELTAVLAFSALSNNDKVGMMLFTDEVEKYVSPKKGKKWILRILSEILQFTPQSGKTKISGAIQYLMKISKKRGVVFVISDFLDKNYQKSLRILSQRHDVVAFRVIDRVEESLPKAGLMDFYDPESGEKFVINTSSKKLRENFRIEIEKEQKKVEDEFKKMKIDMITFYTDTSYVEELMKFFKKRAKRR